MSGRSTNTHLRYPIEIEIETAAAFPDMTPTQLRIGALVTGLLSSHEIARILRTSEGAVQKVRSRMRKRLRLAEHASLGASLISLVE